MINRCEQIEEDNDGKLMLHYLVDSLWDRYTEASIEGSDSQIVKRSKL